MSSLVIRTLLNVHPIQSVVWVVRRCLTVSFFPALVRCGPVRYAWLMIGHRCGLITIIHIVSGPERMGERERNEVQVEFPRSERATRELIKLNFMFLEKQDNYAPTFTQLAFNTCTQTLIWDKVHSTKSSLFQYFLHFLPFWRNQLLWEK